MDDFGLSGAFKSIEQQQSDKNPLEAELEKFQKDIGPKIQSYQSEIMQKFANLEKKCFFDSNKKPSSNKDKKASNEEAEVYQQTLFYSDCMKQQQKKLKKEQTYLNYGLQYSQYRLIECFQQQFQSQDHNYEQCKHEAKQNLDGIFKKFISKMN